MADSLLSHLATKFAAHEENWATEALGYILRRSPVARDTVRDLVGKLGVALPASLVYANQVSGDDDARPDLVARDDQGTQRLLIEAKFWAGLTEHQPVTYLERLSLGQGGLGHARRMDPQSGRPLSRYSWTSPGGYQTTTRARAA
jgi:hypothetical protein